MPFPRELVLSAWPSPRVASCASLSQACSSNILSTTPGDFSDFRLSGGRRLSSLELLLPLDWLLESSLELRLFFLLLLRLLEWPDDLRHFFLFSFTAPLCEVAAAAKASPTDLSCCSFFFFDSSSTSMTSGFTFIRGLTTGTSEDELARRPCVPTPAASLRVSAAPPVLGGAVPGANDTLQVTPHLLKALRRPSATMDPFGPTSLLGRIVCAPTFARMRSFFFLEAHLLASFDGFHRMSAQPSGLEIAWGEP